MRAVTAILALRHPTMVEILVDFQDRCLAGVDALDERRPTLAAT